MNHADLPDVHGASLPETYVKARTALAECSSIDECKDWADKAKALASYAKQSNDDQLRKMADRIQARAIRRCGELLKQIEPDKGGRPSKTKDASDPSFTRSSAATEAGLSERQRKTALRVATVPADQFNEAVDSDSPPTVTKLAEQGKQSKPLVDLKGRDPKEFNRALHFCAMLEMHLESLQKYEIESITSDLNENERKEVRDSIAKIDAIHDQIVTRI